MTTIERQLSQINGANVPQPTQNGFSSTGLEAFANDAAYEAVYTAVDGSRYWNTTEKIVRRYTDSLWGYDNIALNAVEDSASTGADVALAPTLYDLIRFTNAGLSSIRSITSTTIKLLYLVNNTGSAVTIRNNDAAAIDIVTGTGDDLIMEDGTTLPLIYDLDASRWRVAGGSGSGGGGLELQTVTNADSPVTAQIGKHYLTDTSGGAITFTLPQIAGIPSSKEASAAIRFSDCANNWHVNAVTLNPDATDSIDGGTLGDALVLNVQSQNIQISRESSTNWCLDTNFQPVLEGSGGTGDGLLNFMENGDFEDGTSNWAKTGDFGTLGLDTTTQLEGTQSLTWTNNYTSTRGTVEGDLKTVDLGYRGDSAQWTAKIRVVGTGGQYTAYLTKGGVKDDATEIKERTFSNGEIVTIGAIGTFTFDNSEYKLVVEDVTGTNGDVITIDICRASTQGAGFIAEDPSYDQSEVTLTPESGSFDFEYAEYIPYRDGSGNPWLKGQITTDGTGLPNASTCDFTITGVTFKTTESEANWGVSWNNNASDGNNITAYAIQGDDRIQIRSTTSKNWSTRIYLSFDVPLDSWPTWATKDGGKTVLSKENAVQNEKMYANNASSTSLSTTEADVSWVNVTKGALESSVEKVIDSPGEFLSTCILRAIDLEYIAFYYDSGSGYFLLGQSEAANNSANLSIPFEAEIGDKIKVTARATSGTPSAGTTSYWRVSKDPDQTGQGAVGVATDDNADDKAAKRLTNYQVGTFTLDNEFTGGELRCKVIKIGEYVHITGFGQATHSSATSRSTNAGIVPEWARPTNTNANCFAGGAGASTPLTFNVANDGTLTVQYAVARSDTGFGINGGYIITGS